MAVAARAAAALAAQQMVRRLGFDLDADNCRGTSRNERFGSWPRRNNFLSTVAAAAASAAAADAAAAAAWATTRPES